VETLTATPTVGTGSNAYPYVMRCGGRGYGRGGRDHAPQDSTVHAEYFPFRGIISLDLRARPATPGSVAAVRSKNRGPAGPDRFWTGPDRLSGPQTVNNGLDRG
jgi:hypothetical protein